MRPERAAITSAMIEIATSSGVAAPMSRPHGECTRANACSVAPAACRRAAAAERPDEAGFAAERREDRGLVELRVVAEHDDRVAWSERALVNRLGWPADVHRGVTREALRARERLARVDDDDAVARLRCQRRDRRRIVDRADQYERRRDAERVQVDGELAPERLPPVAVMAQGAGAPLAERGEIAGDGVVEQLGTPERADHAVADHGELRAGAVSLDERRDRRALPGAGSLERLRGDLARITRELVHEDLHGPAAHQARRVRELVGDAIAQHARRAIAVEHLERVRRDVALDAAAGDRSLDRAVAVDQHERTRLERRGPLGVDEQRAHDAPAIREPATADHQLFGHDAHRENPTVERLPE
jgi:hypothetical protein